MDTDTLLDQIEMIFRARGLTSAHGRVFGALMLSKTPLTQREIAKITNYSIPAISLALDDLSKHGLVRGRKIPGKRERVYTVTGDLVGMFKNFIKSLRDDQVKPFLAGLQEMKEKTPGINKVIHELDRLNVYLTRLLQVEVD